jgi:branched-subunit amino acid transport protein AzlD
VIEPLRSSRLAGELARRMPAGLMLILVVYLLRDVPRRPVTSALASIAALLIVVGLQWWRGHALLAATSRSDAPAPSSTSRPRSRARS